MFKLLFFVLSAEILASIGQILFKKSANSIETYDLRKMDTHIRFLKDIFTKPLVWVGFVFMVISLVLWLVALSQGNLSLVFPIGSIQYILILFSAHWFLGEKIDRMKLIGTLLVVVGIVLITLS